MIKLKGKPNKAQNPINPQPQNCVFIMWVIYKAHA